jgi:hypothetical protein
MVVSEVVTGVEVAIISEAGKTLCIVHFDRAPGQSIG